MALSFSFRKRTEKVDWRRIAGVDLDRLVQTVDVTVLQDNIWSICFCNLDSEDGAQSLDPLVKKMVRLAQLTIEYLLFSQDYLQKSLLKSQENSDRLLKEVEELRGDLERKKAAYVDLKRKAKKLKKMLEEYQLMVRSQNVASSTAVFKCPYCAKVFVSGDFLAGHIHRRHVESMIQPQSGPSQDKPVPVPVVSVTTADHVISQDQASYIRQDNDRLRQQIEELRHQLQQSKAQLQIELDAREARQQQEKEKELHLFRKLEEENRIWKQQEEDLMRTSLQQEMNQLRASLMMEVKKVNNSQQLVEQAVKRMKIQEKSLEATRRDPKSKADPAANQLPVEQLKAEFMLQLENMNRQYQEELSKMEKKFSEREAKTQTLHQIEVDKMREALELHSRQMASMAGKAVPGGIPEQERLQTVGRDQSWLSRQPSGEANDFGSDHYATVVSAWRPQQVEKPSPAQYSDGSQSVAVSKPSLRKTVNFPSVSQVRDMVLEQPNMKKVADALLASSPPNKPLREEPKIVRPPRPLLVSKDARDGIGGSLDAPNGEYSEISGSGDEDSGLLSVGEYRPYPQFPDIVARYDHGPALLKNLRVELSELLTESLQKRGISSDANSLSQAMYAQKNTVLNRERLMTTKKNPAFLEQRDRHRALLEQCCTLRNNQSEGGNIISGENIGKKTVRSNDSSSMTTPFYRTPDKQMETFLTNETSSVVILPKMLSSSTPIPAHVVAGKEELPQTPERPGKKAGQLEEEEEEDSEHDGDANDNDDDDDDDDDIVTSIRQDDESSVSVSPWDDSDEDVNGDDVKGQESLARNPPAGTQASSGSVKPRSTAPPPQIAKVLDFDFDDDDTDLETDKDDFEIR